MYPTMERLHALGRACTLMGALLAGLGTAKAQTYVHPSGPLYQIRDSMEAHFDSLRAVLPDSVFNAEGGEYAHFQRWLRNWETRLTPHGDPDVYDQVVKNYCDAKFQDEGSFKSNNDPWQELGPMRRRNNMVGIGPIRSITISDDNPDHMLCTSSSGGLFYTTNAADEWNNAGTDLGWPHSGCQFAVYYPGETTHWYAISAYEVKLGNRISYVGGVYRKQSSGAWKNIADHSVLGGSGTEAVKLLFDRKENGQFDHRLFVATSKGLYVSDDPASTSPAWTQVSISTPQSILDAYPGYTVSADIHVHDIEYLPYDEQDPTSTLCAAMRFAIRHVDPQTEAVTMHNIWRFMLSTDNGDTWSESVDQPAINTVIEWATVETSAAAQTSFYCHAVIGGNSWVRMHDTTNDSWTLMASGFKPDFARGHAFGVDQHNPDWVFVGAYLYVNWYDNGVIESHHFRNGHDDVEDIVGHPSNQNELWVANHGGVSRIDLTATPPDWTDKSDGLGVAEVLGMATSQNKPDYVVVGLYHDHSAITRTPYDNGWDPDWAELGQKGDGTRCLVDRSDANLVYHSVHEGLWRRNDNAETVNTNSSDDLWIDSQWWSEGDLNPRNGHHLYRATLINKGTTQWAHPTGNRSHVNREIEVTRSFDKGVTNAIVSDFSSDPDISRLAGGDYRFDWEMFWWMRSNPANPDHLYVGLRNWDWQNRIFRSTMIDHPDVQTVKESWEEVPHPRRLANGTQVRDAPPVSIAFDPEDENIIYVAYSSSLFEDPMDYASPVGKKMVYRIDVSDLNAFSATGTGPFDCDGTYPCADLTMNLPNTTVGFDCLAFEQGSNGGLYVATEFGVYFTNNKRIAAFDPQASPPVDPDDLSNTSGWVRLGGGLPHVTARGLEINYNVNRIRVGQTGRGVWEHALHCPSAEDFNETGTYAANEFLEALNDIVSEAVVPNGLKVDYRAGTEVRLTPGFHAEAGSRFHAFIHPCDLPGNSFKPKNLPMEVDKPIDRPDDRPVAMRTLDLFPNPASSHLSIRCAGLEENEIAQVRLFDATGKQALVVPMRGPLLQLDVSRLNGLFMVVVDRGSERSTGRVIIH